MKMYYIINAASLILQMFQKVNNNFLQKISVYIKTLDKKIKSKINNGPSAHKIFQYFISCHEISINDLTPI